MLGRVKRKGNSVHCWRNCKVGAATVENNMDIPQKIKNRTTIRSSNSTPGTMSERNKNSVSKRCLCPMFKAVLFTKVKIWKQSMLINGRMSGGILFIYLYIYTHTIIFSFNAHVFRELSFCNPLPVLQNNQF